MPEIASRPRTSGAWRDSPRISYAPPRGRGKFARKELDQALAGLPPTKKAPGGDGVPYATLASLHGEAKAELLDHINRVVTGEKTAFRGHGTGSLY